MNVLKSLLVLFALSISNLAASAVAFDAYSSGGSSLSYTCTPSGTARGVLVLLRRNSASPSFTDVTFGGVSMADVAGSPNTKLTGEAMAVHVFFLGSSIPAGAQTVVFVNAVATDVALTGCVTLTAANDTEIVDTDATISSDAVANPSAVLVLGGATSFAAQVFGSGQNAEGSVTPLTNWTSRDSADLGSQTGFIHTYDIIGTTDVTMGWTQASEDAVAVGVAVTESAGGASGLLLRRRR